MAVYKFRVTFEDYDEVWRDIEIKPVHTFKDLHTIIQQSIKFDASKSASFFMSNDNWTKEREIALEPRKDKDGKEVITMENAVLGKFIIDPHQKIYYVFDTFTFFIELIKIILAADPKAIYPRCVKFNGDAPPQYKKVILPAAAATEEESEELLLDEEDEPDTEETTDEVFDEDHGFEGEEGEEAEPEVEEEEADGQQFDDED